MKRDCYLLLVVLFLFLYSSGLFAQYGIVDKRVINGVEYTFYNFNREELYAYVTGYTSAIPENLVLPTSLIIDEESNIDGLYPVDIIKDYAFEGCTTLKSIRISGTSILSGAFKNCTNLTFVDWESTNTVYHNVDNSAFEGCTSLATIHLPKNIEYISDNAFKDCPNLEHISLPDSLMHISIGAFEGCTSLCEIHFPSKLSEIQREAFKDCHSLIEIRIPSTLKILEGRTFQNCTSLKSVIIEDGDDELITPRYSDGYGDVYTFQGCEVEYLYFGRQISSQIDVGFRTIKTLEIGTNIHEIGYYMFDGFRNLSTIKLPKNMETIGHYAFRNCTALKEMTLPESLTYLGEGAFQGCTTLSTIYSYITNPQETRMDNQCFEAVPQNCTLFVPKGNRQYYAKNSNWDCFGRIKEMETNYVNNLSQLNNGKVYRLEPAEARRGVICTRDGVKYLDACGGHSSHNNSDITISDENTNQQFAIYNLNGNYYLYSVGQQQFVSGYETIENELFFKLSPQPGVTITIKPSSVDGEFIFIVGDNQWVNVSNHRYGCVGNYMIEDGGNRISIAEVGNISEETLLAIESQFKAPTSISLNYSTLRFDSIGQTDQLMAKIEPDDAFNKTV